MFIVIKQWICFGFFYLFFFMKTFILVLVSIPLFLFAQCEEETKLFDEVGTYTGCLNDSDYPDGQGIMTFLSGDIYDGFWIDGKIDGMVLITYSNGDKYDGYFADNKFTEQGTYKWVNGDSYIGSWKNGKKHGDGKLTTLNKHQVQEENGEFKFDILFNGVQKNSYKDGTLITTIIKDGEIITEKRNDKNYYIPSDISGNNKFTKVVVNRKENHFWVTMHISGIEGEWVFDTGGYGLSIGRKMFERLEKEGVKYTDLNKQVKSFGVGGGESLEKVIVLSEVAIGDYTLKNVVANVDLMYNHSLMGAQFFDKFSDVEWFMKESIIKFYK
jgi:hypothetical protein